MTTDHPKLSIIIATYNCVELTRQCLKTLVQYTSGIDYEVIVVDDCSTDGTVEYLATLEAPFRVLLNQEKGSYAKNNNLGATKAKADLLCFLNNDTILTENWWQPMVGAFDVLPNVGVIGNTQVNPKTGRFDHLGVIISRAGRTRHFGRYLRFNPFKSEYRKWSAVTAACCMIRKDLFLGANGFDEGFINGSEDIDLCLRLSEMDRDHFVSNKSVIGHAISSSPDRHKFNDVNVDRLRSKWLAYIKEKQGRKDAFLWMCNDFLTVLFKPKDTIGANCPK